MPAFTRSRHPRGVAATPWARPADRGPHHLAAEVIALDDRAKTDRTARPWLAIGLIGLFGLAALSALVASHVVLAFDQPLLDMATQWTAWQGVWNFFSDLGNLPMIPIGAGFVLWLLYKKRRREALLVALLFAAATAGSEGLKALVARPRPQGGGAGIPGVVYSFPSGHAFEDVMILGMIALRLWRRARSRWIPWTFTILAVVVVVFVCIARVALGVHYPSDMLAGLFGGFAALGLYGWWSRPGSWADHPPYSET
jgi:undecaprenyl-diphosphatase